MRSTCPRHSRTQAGHLDPSDDGFRARTMRESVRPASCETDGSAKRHSPVASSASGAMMLQ